MATVWTKSAKDKLTRLRAEGYSYATIAAMMGTTKNVLLGHVWREKIKNGHQPEPRYQGKRKLAVSSKRKDWAKRRLEAVTLTLVGYSNQAVASLFGAHHSQVSKWRSDPELRVKAEEIAARLPGAEKPGKHKKRKQRRVISPEVRAQRAEHMRRVSRAYWDEKRATQ